MKDTTQAALLRARAEVQELLDGILGKDEYAFALGIQTSDMYEPQESEHGTVQQSAVMTNAVPTYAIELFKYSIMAVEARMQQEAEATGKGDLGHLYTPEAITDFVNFLCMNSNKFDPETDESAIIRSAMASPIDPEDGRAPVTEDTILLVKAFLDKRQADIRQAIATGESRIKNAENN